MVSTIYLASTEGASGKSAVAVGLLAHLARRAGRVGVFRPVVRDDGTGRLLALLTAQLPEATRGNRPGDPPLSGVTYEQLHSDPAAAMARIVERFHNACRDRDTMLVVGSDYTDVASPAEFAVNARIAANLGAPMLLIVPAVGRHLAEVRAAAEIAISEARSHHARVLGVIANRVDPDCHEQWDRQDTIDGVPLWLVPDAPILRAPTVRDLMAACNGELIHGSPDLLDRESMGLVVAAMRMPHVLDRLIESGVVISPGDRDDVVLGVLLAHRAQTFPTPAALVLNGGFPLPPQVDRLIDGIGVDLPVISCATGTMATAEALGNARGLITPRSSAKIAAAIDLVAGSVDLEALLGRLAPTPGEAVTPVMFEHRLVERARRTGATIVLPEGTEERILRAASTVLDRGIAELVLVGEPETVRAKAASLGVDLGDTLVVDPQRDPLRAQFAHEYAKLRAHKGITDAQAYDIVSDPSYFGTLMVLAGLADGMVSGSITTTAATIRPALEVVRTVPGVSVVSSVFLMCLADRVLVYGDCAVNPDPSAEQLADIAISSARTAQRFGIEPRVAMLSYSTGSSGSGADVEKVRAATEIVRRREPDLLVEGPIQYDAAVDPAVAATKLKDSPVAGQATVLIFPDLNTGNNTYKAVQRSAAAVAIGPVLQGLNRPVNDLSRGALVEDIVNTIAITAIQSGEQ